MKRNRKLMFGAVALLAAAGGGAAIAASDSSPAEENQAIIDDAAQQLGISPNKLGDALKKALGDRVDAAVTAGRITKAEGDAFKQRIESGAYPLFFGPHRGFGHFGFHGLDAAASYLGITEEQLRTELEGGKTLAQVAQAQGKSVAGLVDALVADAKQHLDAAVAAGRLTQSQANELLSGLRDRITSRVNSREPTHPPEGFRHFGRPPA
jgi:predicted nuclease of restriction endonuclease-like RecB superfamily